MSSKTVISNLAISHLGVSKEISNFDTERSPEASACRRFYPLALGATLRDFPWSFAETIQALALIEEDPNDEWAFAYRYPSDCKNFRRILSGVRNDTRQSRVPYLIGKDSAGKVIYTDKELAEGKYTAFVDDPDRYPEDFTLALSFRLAAYLSPRITGGDPFKMGERAIKFYEYEITKAEAANVNEQQDDEEPESEFTRVRG